LLYHSEDIIDFNDHFVLGDDFETFMTSLNSIYTFLSLYSTNATLVWV
jgi:hypothetical protein